MADQLLDRIGVLKVKTPSMYYQLNKFAFRHFDTLTCYDTTSQTIQNDRTKTTNKFLDMRGFVKINEHTFAVNENGMVFYIVLLDHVKTLNVKSGQMGTSKKFNLDLAMDVFTRYGYDSVQVSNDGLYATDCLSVMFIGNVDSFDMKPFVKSFTQRENANVPERSVGNTSSNDYSGR